MAHDVRGRGRHADHQRLRQILIVTHSPRIAAQPRNGERRGTEDLGLGDVGLGVEIEEVGRCAVRLVAHDETVFVRPLASIPRDSSRCRRFKRVAEVALDPARAFPHPWPCRPSSSAAYCWTS